MSAVEHADDHFLADVASLRERDRARLDPGFERDRVLRHVHAEERIPGLDARGLERRGITGPGAGGVQRRQQRRFLVRRDVDANTRDAELIDPGDDRWSVVELAASVLVGGPRRNSLHTPHHTLDDRRRRGPMDPHAAQAPGHVGKLDVLTEEELIQTLQS
jgi:hypothetical protein